jgi:hypothetical protein
MEIIMNIIKTIKPLPQPKILSHNDGGVGDADVSDPTKPLEVLIGPIEMHPKDRIDLFWGKHQNPVDTYIHSPDAPDTHGIFSLYVDTQWIEQGTAEVKYTYTPFPSNTPEMSVPTEVIVKLLIPGGRDPDPSSPYENEGLMKPTILPPGVITSPEGVSAIVSPYLNMAEGDIITLSWNGEFISLILETEEQLNKPVIISIPAEIIEAAGDSDMLEVRYEVRDVVNNWSRWSLPEYTEVEAGNSSLPAPVAPQAENLMLDLDKLAGESIQTLVVPDPQIEKGDEVTLVVQRYTAEGMTLEPYTSIKSVENPSNFVEFLLPFDQFVPITQGRARLKYSVRKSTGVPLRSKSLSLTIIGEVQHLQAPIVPAANDGILDPASRNVSALIPPYYFMADGNDVTLVWAGKTASGANILHEELRTLNRGDVGKVLEYRIPQEKVSILAGGTVQVHYTVDTFTKAFFKSPLLDLRVSHDTSILLPTPSVDNVGPDGVLDPADIVLDAKVRIQPYIGMDTGDRVILHWDGRSPNGDFSTYTIINSGTVNREVVFRVPKSIVVASLDAQVKVWYEVERGPQTFTSREQVFTIKENPVPPLPEPRIKEAQGDTLAPGDVVNGATFVIAANANFKPNDDVVLHLTGPKGGDSKEKRVTDADAGKELSVVFSRAIIDVNAGKTIEATYTVRRASGVVQDSASLVLKVLEGPITLPAPTLDTVGPDGILNPSNIPDSGATVRVSYEGMSTGDTVLVSWRAAASYDTPTQVIGGNVELQFNVPKPYINQSIGSSASVTYTVTRAGTAQVSAPLWLQVKQGLDFDTSPVTLDGKIYLIPGSPDLLPAFPANTTVQRNASGGQAPYTYTSSDLQVAQVDENGLTSVRGKGTATISVTDALGETKSYQVNVTGVIHCLGLGGGKFAQISTAASNQGSRVPAIGELNEIFNAYGNRWPMGNGWYWSSTVAAANIAGMKWYFVKNLNTGANFKLLEHKSCLGVGIR